MDSSMELTMLSSSGAYLRTKMPFLISPPVWPSNFGQGCPPAPNRAARAFFPSRLPAPLLHHASRRENRLLDLRRDARCIMRASGQRRRCQRPAVCRILRVQQGLSIVFRLSFISLTFRTCPYCDCTPCCLEPKRPPHHRPGNWLRNSAGEPFAARSVCLALIFSPTARASFAGRILR